MKNKIIGATPFVALFIYLLLGFTADLWHPGWLVFMLVPIIGSFLGTENVKDGIMGGSVLIIITLFLALSLIAGFPWHIAALIFIFVPAMGVILYS